jgi:hypothetical protein
MKDSDRDTQRGLPVVTQEVYEAFFRELERVEEPTGIVAEWCGEIARENPMIAQLIMASCDNIPEEYRKRAYLSSIGVYRLLESQIGNNRARKIWNS